MKKLLLILIFLLIFGSTKIVSAQTYCCDNSLNSYRWCATFDNCQLTPSFTGCNSTNTSHPSRCSPGDICWANPGNSRGICSPSDDNPLTTPTPIPIDTFAPTLCPGDDPSAGYPGLMSALGCIETYPMRFLYSVRQLILGIAGGIAFLLMIVGAFFILTSQGNPERLQRGKEILLGSLTGILFIIFTWFILNLITRDVLNLF
jgi:hypothetical protein